MPKLRKPNPDVQQLSPEKYQEVINELVAALEPCLECENLSWEAENAADILVKRYKESGEQVR